MGTHQELVGAVGVDKGAPRSRHGRRRRGRGTRAGRGRPSDDQARWERQEASGTSVEGGGHEQKHQVSPEEGIDAAGVTDRSGGR